MPLFPHAGREESGPTLIRGHPEVVPTKVGNHFRDWIPVFAGNTGFRLEFIRMKIGAGMTTFSESGS